MKDTYYEEYKMKRGNVKNVIKEEKQMYGEGFWRKTEYCIQRKS